MRFLQSLSDIQAFLQQLSAWPCIFCQRAGALRRHGFIRGYISPSRRGIRAWRVFCKPRHGGCGRSFSIRRSTSLVFCCFSSKQLSLFIHALLDSPSIKAAWEASNFPLSLDSAYRIVHSLKRLLPVLRSRLFARGPPQSKKATSPLFEFLAVLNQHYGVVDPVAAFQFEFQYGLFSTR